MKLEEQREKLEMIQDDCKAQKDKLMIAEEQIKFG